MLIGNVYILLKSSLSPQTKYIQPNTHTCIYKAKGLISTQMSLQIHFVTHYNYTPVLYYNHNADFKCLHIIEIFIKPTN